MARQRRLRVSFAIITVAVLAIGAKCEDESVVAKKAKRTECNAFIDKLNQSSRELAKHTGKKSEGDLTEGEPNHEMAKSRQKLANLYSNMASETRAMNVENETLRVHAERYAKLCTDLSAAATKIADHAATGEGEQAQAAQTKFNELVERENAKIAEINGFCARL